MIDELQRVKDFGTSEPPPSETARNAARSALSRAIADAERQHQHVPVPVRGRRFGGYVRAPRLLPIGAAVAVAAVAVLFFTAPWSSSPGFLERAEAALTPPQGTILHVKMVERTACLASSQSVRWTAQFWVDERTHRYHGLWRDPFNPYPFRYFTLRQIGEGIGCLRGSAYEMGGIPGELPWLRFVPPNRLVGIYTLSLGRLGTPDPVTALRRAIRDGTARDQGRRKLNGRTVERIRFDPCLSSHPSSCSDLLANSDGRGYAYVDPETYYRVEIRLGGSEDVIRFATYEYLPRTATNLALTNIRAQHPHARLPW